MLWLWQPEPTNTVVLFQIHLPACSSSTCQLPLSSPHHCPSRVRCLLHLFLVILALTPAALVQPHFPLCSILSAVLLALPPGRELQPHILLTVLEANLHACSMVFPPGRGPLSHTQYLLWWTPSVPHLFAELTSTPCSRGQGHTAFRTPTNLSTPGSLQSGGLAQLLAASPWSLVLWSHHLPRSLTPPAWDYGM